MRVALSFESVGENAIHLESFKMIDTCTVVSRIPPGFRAEARARDSSVCRDTLC